ncbi:polyamine-modulated factor 1-binding protein 1 isoform x1 [Limosa lapponica baueri]|uniref:Polyamine-modulated factor 1-binding protein 1 isoform x1 n=1 Tax=Limosa lapponica baueri TaxID=1758121 RepID=A0A2I0U045_LIMLA|nr:polyamine-modulated factor 1-binding protein 1 isoform x1 [Limosa lapponica baueri]
MSSAFAGTHAEVHVKHKAGCSRAEDLSTADQAEGEAGRTGAEMQPDPAAQPGRGGQPPAAGGSSEAAKNCTLAVRECPKCGTSREVPAPLGQPEGPCGGLQRLEEATSGQSSSIQQLQQETETWQPQGQRQALVLEPQQGEPQACQDTEQQELEPAQVLALILQLHLDFFRGKNRERLDQLQQQECAVEQKLQELAFLMQQYQVVMSKEQKDEAVQTEVTSYIAAHSRADTSSSILKEECTELFDQKPWGRAGEGNASQPPLSQAAQAWSTLQHTEERPCSSMGKGTPCEANCQVEDELQAVQKQAGSSKAEQAQSREVAARLQAELSQWQWKQQLTLEQALKHMHAASHAQEKLQKSQEQLQALREQLRAQEEQSQGLRCSLARLQEELGATHSQGQQSLQQLSRAKETIKDLRQEVASNRKHLAELLQQVHDTATLQAELAQAQQDKAKQEEKIIAYEEERQQLHWELRKLQGSQEQSKQEVETLRSSHALACSDSSRLHKEKELVLVNISQYVKEQMQSNEKLGHKIQRQMAQSTELTSEKEHLQDTQGRMQEENTYFTARTHEQHHKYGQPKTLQGNNLTVPAPHDSAGLPPPTTHLQDKKQRKTKQGLD